MLMSLLSPYVASFEISIVVTTGSIKAPWTNDRLYNREPTPITSNQNKKLPQLKSLHDFQYRGKYAGSTSAVKIMSTVRWSIDTKKMMSKGSSASEFKNNWRGLPNSRRKVKSKTNMFQALELTTASMHKICRSFGEQKSGRLLATPGLFIKEWREDPLSTLDMDTNCRSSSLGVWSCGLAICQKGLGEVLGMGLFWSNSDSIPLEAEDAIDATDAIDDSRRPRLPPYWCRLSLLNDVRFSLLGFAPFGGWCWCLELDGRKIEWVPPPAPERYIVLWSGWCVTMTFEFWGTTADHWSPGLNSGLVLTFNNYTTFTTRAVFIGFCWVKMIYIDDCSG